MKSSLALLLAAGFLCMPCLSAYAQQEGKAPWEEYDKLIDARKTIAAYGPDLFGDSVDLQSGALSFSTTDVSIPGNSKLPVVFARTFSVSNRKGYYAHDLPLADWDLDVPRLSGVFAPAWHDQRCTNATPPAVQGGDKYFQADDYWQGNQADMPGGGKMLRVISGNVVPSTGGPYRWMTSGNTYFSCLASIKNGDGEGFLAVTSDGTKYWFDWLAQYAEPTLDDKTASGVPIHVARRKTVLYATRVEDRFGNWVTYSYSNLASGPARLTAINSNDGRQLSVSYNTNGQIQTVSDGSRTWTYQYAYPTSTTGTLTTIIQPDTSRWSIDFAALADASFHYNKSLEPEDTWRSCFYPGDVLNASDVTGTITHPSGAVGQFTVSITRHGRSNVPALCGNYTTPSNNPNDDVAYYPINWDAYSLKAKTVSGPGLTTATWTYGYGSTVSWFYPASGGGLPVCGSSSGCQQPTCTTDACAGTDVTVVTGPDGHYARYTFGNSYRYNEGKLLKVQRDEGATTLYTERNTYELAQSGQPFPTPIGDSPQGRDDGFAAEYQRPLKHKEIVQDGASLNYHVDQFDSFARPLQVTRSSIGTGGQHIDPPKMAPTLTVPSATNTTGSYGVSWSTISGATHYPLELRFNGGSWNSIQDTSAITWSASGQASGTYDYRVRACNAGGCSAYSTTKTVTVALPPATAPTVIVPATDNDGAFTVSMSAVNETTWYALWQRKDGGSWEQVYSGAATSKAISGLSDGTYDYQAKACNEVGCTDFSAIATTVVTFPPTGAPLVTTPATDGDGAYTVSWTSVTSATSYRLEQRKDAGTWSQIHNGSATSKAVSGLTNGTYDYRARACNVGGCSSYSAVRTTVVTFPPSGVPVVTAPSSDSDGAFTVSWTSISGTTDYRLEQRKDGGSWSQIYSGTALSKAISGLGSGTYDYRARACNVGGCGGYSTLDTTVVLLPPGSAPTVTAPASDYDGAFTVSWTVVVTSSEYRLEQRKDAGTWSQAYAGTGASKAVSGLTNGTYDYRARACNASGCSAYSAIRSTVVTLPPGTPTLSAPYSAGTYQDYLVSWTTVSTATSYELQVDHNGAGWATTYTGTGTSSIRNNRYDGEYSYRVRACNVAGCGPYSTAKTVSVAGGGGGGFEPKSLPLGEGDNA